jgi:amidohydrolase
MSSASSSTLSNDLKSAVDLAADRCRDRLVEIRRDLHMHPELAFEEHRTAGVVAAELARLGIEHRSGIGGTGVVGVIKGMRPGPVLAIRADMDALPIQEETGLPFASTVPGKMHACGHDLHTATLLGVGTVLQELRQHLAGEVRLLFQPAEEVGGGAKAMIADGAMDGVTMALSLHNRPEIPVGRFGIVHGPANSASDTFEIVVHGKSGHGARPYAAVDPIVAAAQLIGQLQTIVSRDVRALDSCVVTVGSIHAGDAHNVIPDRCVMKGTVRTRQAEARELAEKGIRRICEGIAAGLRVRCDVTYRHGTPAIINDDAMLQRTLAAIQAQIGDVADEYEPSLGGEDFSYMAQMAPAFRLLVGSSQPGRTDKVHNSDYQPDEDCIAFGVRALARTALDVVR